MICLKTAEYLHEFSNVNTIGVLNTLLRGLEQARSRYPPDRIESNLDLVSCNIMDILRCKCVGRKRDIKRIYQALQQHERYEVVRVKVKLNESTRDILVNFRCRYSFLIGEMQLALGSKDSLNEKFCHYLYELQRSPIPVVFEIAGQMVSGDTRMGYLARTPLRFKPLNDSEELRSAVVFADGALRCSHRHQPSPMQFMKNSVPFCCSLCS